MNAAGVLRRATAAVALAALAGCATVPAGAPTAKPDPWENWNRKVYAFNEGLDKAVLKPVATAYRDVVPELVRTGIALDGKTFQGVVKMEVERAFQFPKDTSAKILTAGLLGDQYIGLEPGGDDKNLAPGDTLAQTQSAVVLENLIGQFLTGKASDAGTAPSNGASAAASSAGGKP